MIQRGVAKTLFQLDRVCVDESRHEMAYNNTFSYHLLNVNGIACNTLHSSLSSRTLSLLVLLFIFSITPLSKGHLFLVGHRKCGKFISFLQFFFIIMIILICLTSSRVFFTYIYCPQLISSMSKSILFHFLFQLIRIINKLSSVYSF